jgi:hypothetical protein
MKLKNGLNKLKRNNIMTAVEWFYNELKELIKQSELTEMKPSEFDDREAKLLEQGKEMEKQQQSYSEEDMAESFMACWKANVSDGIECKLSFKEWFEQFKKK